MFELRNTKESYLKVTIWGLVIGLITEACNLLPNDGLLGLSSIAGSYGFWIFTTTFVVYFSCSNKNALVNTFLYLGGMCVSYYIFDAFVVLFTPNLSRTGFIDWGKLIFWGGAAIVCALAAYVLYYWNNGKWYSDFLYALPVAGMLVDTIGCALKLYYSHTQLVMFILDITFLIIMIVFFFLKSKKKVVFIAVLIIAATIGYFAGASNYSYGITTQSTIVGELNGEEETFFIKIRDDGVILEREGNEEIFEAIDIDSLHTVPEIVHALQDYYESQGGTCVTIQ